MFDLEFLPDDPNRPHHFTVFKCLGKEEGEFLTEEEKKNTKVSVSSRRLNDMLKVMRTYYAHDKF